MSDKSKGAADCLNDVSMTEKRSSRRNAWIQKRWKIAVQSVCTIGFKTFEELLVTGEGEKHKEQTDEHQIDDKNNLRRRSSTPVCHNFVIADANDAKWLCHVCEEPIGIDEEDEQAISCHRCHIVLHEACRLNLASTNCQPKNVKNKLKSNSPDESECNDEPRIVDPIYLALKKGNKMASCRKSSLVDYCSSGSRGHSQIRDSTPTSGVESPSPLSSTGLVKPSHGSSTLLSAFASSASRTSSASSHLSNGVSKSLARSSPSRANLENDYTKLGSAPNLVAQKSVDSSEDSAVVPFKKPIQKPVAVRRAPKLDSKMKSLSLDCPDAAMARKNSNAVSNIAPTRHTLRVPPCKNYSFESPDDTARSSTSCSPCPSSACGSSLTLPSNSYAVTHDYFAKFPEEIDLRVGERVLLVDNSDPDWWQGHNISGRLGIFPATCVAHIHCNEQVMQIVQNVCLWVLNKNHRLYRDQIVFAQLDEIAPEGLITVRTERDFHINCPVQYLMSLD